MSQPTHLKRGRTVSENIDRWTHRTASRIGAKEPEPFQRAVFLKRFWADYPGDPRAEDFANAFEAAVNESRGNMDRFRQALKRELDSVAVKWGW
jgi:hypothetical protein